MERTDQVIEGITIRFLRREPRGVWPYRLELPTPTTRRPFWRVEFFPTYQFREGRATETGVLHSWVIEAFGWGDALQRLAHRAAGRSMIAVDIASILEEWG